MITDDLINLMIGKISAIQESAFSKGLITQENKALDENKNKDIYDYPSYQAILQEPFSNTSTLYLMFWKAVMWV